MSSYRCGYLPGTPQPDHRVCAFHQGYVFMAEDCPNVHFMAHDTDRNANIHQVVLSKIVIGIGAEDDITWLLPSVLDSVTCDNIPGALKGTGCCGDVNFTVESYPCIMGREPLTRIGGLVTRITTDKPCGISIKLGGGNYTCLHGIHGTLISGTVFAENNTTEVKDDKIFLSSNEHKMLTVCRSPEASWTLQEEEGHGAYGVTHTDKQELYVLCAFAMDREEAERLASADPAEERQHVLDYYRNMFEQWYIKTPDAAINETFEHARLNVEYSWFRPYGWIECMHHWPTMWHMEHTGMEEWAGNADRTKELLRSQMKFLLPNDAIPDMCPEGRARREWGGNNQFFFREVMHYLEMTGDLEFAAEIEPYMDRVLAQTLREYDPLREGIIGWGTQIGNQEDFESTPGKGSGTGCEGARMLEILSAVKSLLGKHEEAEHYYNASKHALAAVKKELWLNDVGRFAWYTDSQGVQHLDTSYHGITYPIIYGQLSDAEAVSSIDHLKHRMTGSHGEMYQSNHFGEHAYWGHPTWGMQCGSNMQPFATAAYAKLGMNNDAIRPLKFIADIVTGPFQRGSFPETANEKQLAYFSPSAAVYGQEVIESIFGLRMNKLNGTMTFSPCFPDDWDHAEIKLPFAHMTYKKVGTKQIFTCELEEELNCNFCLKTHPISGAKAHLDGRLIDVTTKARTGWFEVSAALGKTASFTLELDTTPLCFKVDYAPAVAENGVLSVSATGAEIVGITDFGGNFSKTTHNKVGTVDLTVREGVLKPYERFGWFGLMNFARRMFVLRLKSGDVEFDYPCFAVVVPPVTIDGVCDNGVLTVTIANSSDFSIIGSAKLLYASDSCSSNIQVGPGGKTELTYQLTEKQKNCVTIGTNRAVLLLGDFCCDFSFEAKASVMSSEVIPLSDESLVPRDFWNHCSGKLGGHRSHMFLCQESVRFMEDLFQNHSDIDILPGVPIKLNKNGFIPLDSEQYRNVTIPLNGLKTRKLYVLMSSFITNHNVFGEVFRFELEAVRNNEAYMRPVIVKKLHFPGDLDMAYPGICNFGFPTFVPEEPRGVRPVLPSESHTDDYCEAMPPAYPQHSLWTTNKTIEVGMTVFNLIEINLNTPRELKELRISVTAAEASGGIFAMTAVRE